MKNQLLLVDGSSYIFRAYYGVRADLRNQQGLPTNAVFGFKNMLLQLLNQEDPSHCVLVFDSPGSTFRHEIYTEYKANRDAAPEDLKVQFDPIYKLVKLLNFPVIWGEGVEADDVIGSLVQRFAPDIPVTIVSGDKDLTQLVTESVHMLDTMKNERYTPEAVKEKFGVGPEMIHEYLAIVGDSSDNIPGAKGIGPKTAVKLFNQFGSIEGIYQNVETLKGKQKENIVESKDNVELSLRLTKINCDLMYDASLADYERTEGDLNDLKTFYQEMNFRFDDFVHLHPENAESDGEQTASSSGLETDSYELVQTASRLQEIQQLLLDQKELALDLETTSLQPVGAEIVGISIAWEGGNPIYIPIGHTEKISQLPLETVFHILNPVFQKKELRIIGQNLKYDIMVLSNYKVEIAGKIHDTMIQSFLLDSTRQRHNMNDLADRHLHHKTIKYEDVAGKGKKQISFSEVPVQTALKYAAEDADVTLRLHQKLFPRIESENLTSLYENIEIPVSRVLAKVETHGVKIDVPYLEKLCTKLQEDLEELKINIYSLAGEEFNINSTQQLSVILFDKLGITVGKKKTKTGFSTDASVLEKIARYEPIGADLLNYRVKTKLVNTYLDVLPTLINPRSGRIHTSYSQTVAATGRLSSNNPNLQNIPIRGEDGRKIRNAFIPEPGFLMVSADYSQIELRFLAHLSDDASLVKVYSENGDIHTETAGAVYGVTPDQVKDHQRQAAKAINFGIIYGMGAFRLSQEINVSNRQAKAFIEAYFAKYPKIKTYMDETIEFCRTHGYVETMFHRKRPLPDINSKNHIVRTAAERMAINTRIQGSAADLIKIAMINIQKKLENKFPEAKMIMQIHDELVFEVKEKMVEDLIPMIKKEMEGAVSLKVPLIVDIGYGQNWEEAH